jgi:hypothetical protein
MAVKIKSSSKIMILYYSVDPERFEEVEYLQFALDKLIPYTAALLMLHRAGILPISANFDSMELLQKMCTERRAIVREALLECEFLESEQKQVSF